MPPTMIATQPNCPMAFIRDVVQQALSSGYLTLAAEEQLRLLLQAKHSSEDFKAFMQLQQAAMHGQVKQESREMYCNQQPEI